MGEIVQDSEQYTIQWFAGKEVGWGFSFTTDSLEDAKNNLEAYKRFDKIEGINVKYRIIKETTKREVVYNEL